MKSGGVGPCKLFICYQKRIKTECFHNSIPSSIMAAKLGSIRCLIMIWKRW